MRDVNGNKHELPDEVKGHVHALDEAFKDPESRLRKKGFLYRGVDLDKVDYARMTTPGARIRNVGFMSATSDQRVAHQFAETAQNGGKPLVLHIEHGAGQPAIVMKGGKESETLLPRDTNLEVVRVLETTRGKPVMHVHVRVVKK